MRYDTGVKTFTDISGIAMGLEAFKQTKQLKKSSDMGDLIPMQAFFLGVMLMHGW